MLKAFEEALLKFLSLTLSMIKQEIKNMKYL
jgi:hypothetical protein